MILRRFGEALARQDWSMLTLEIAVVVLGIFLGLQVDDWNENRKQRTQDRLYVERLADDVQSMIDANQAGLESWPVDAAQNSIAALQACQLDDSSQAAFEWSLIQHQAIARLDIERATYDEMVAGGAFARLGDAELKRAISRLYAQANVIEKYIEYFASELGQAGTIIWQRVSFSLVPNDSSETDQDFYPGAFKRRVTYDFGALCMDAQFRNAMLEVWDSAADRQSMSRQFDSQLQVVADQLQHWLSAN
jgi:hypothetical protein